MEQKKIQRIIGVLVVIVLAIIVMPLLLEKNNLSNKETASAQAPALPGQQQEATATTTLASAAPLSTSATATETTDANKEQNALTQDNTAVQPTASISQPATNPVSADEVTASNNPALPTPPELTANSADKQTIGSENSNTVNNKESSVENSKPTPAGSVVYEPAQEPAATSMPAASAATDKQPEKSSALSAQNDEPAQSAAPAVKTKHVTVKIKKTHSAAKITAASAKKGTWAVQMGNFAVKKNAVHLATVLRTAGYKAFTREIKSANGKVSTRVYIGPEIQHASAIKLSNDIHHSLHMQGLVVSYKPLA